MHVFENSLYVRVRVTTSEAIGSEYSLPDELEAIDYKKTIAKYQLGDMNNQITYLNKIAYNKRNEIAYLKIGAQELEGYVHGLNHNQQQHEIQNE